MKAATFSGPTSSMRSSMAWAARAAKASGASPKPSPNWYGCMTCSTPGTGRSPWACMAFMPPSETPATVEPW